MKCQKHDCEHGLFGGCPRCIEEEQIARTEYYRSYVSMAEYMKGRDEQALAAQERASAALERIATLLEPISTVAAMTRTFCETVVSTAGTATPSLPSFDPPAWVAELLAAQAEIDGTKPAATDPAEGENP